MSAHVIHCEASGEPLIAAVHRAVHKSPKYNSSQSEPLSARTSRCLLKHTSVHERAWACMSVRSLVLRWVCFQVSERSARSPNLILINRWYRRRRAHNGITVCVCVLLIAVDLCVCVCVLAQCCCLSNTPAWQLVLVAERTNSQQDGQTEGGSGKDAWSCDWAAAQGIEPPTLAVQVPHFLFLSTLKTERRPTWKACWEESCRIKRMGERERCGKRKQMPALLTTCFHGGWGQGHAWLRHS